MRYVDTDKLIKFANNSKDKTIDANDIARFPTADVRENIKGEWQKVDEQPYFRKHFHKVCCSVCRKQGYDYWNFCPNCGAEMRGEQDG